MTAAKRALLAPLFCATALGGGAAQAADFKAGDWDLSVGGIINAYYTSTSCGGSQAVTGLALASQSLGCGSASGRTVVGNGLLPNALITSVKGKQDGVDIGATLMIGAAVSSSDSISNNNNVDVRQGFFTIGTAAAGTLKIGRDYGLFGASAILSDMTLLGAGAPVNGTQANRVTLGHIGAGYSYLGHYGQLAYSMPAAGAFGFTAAVMSPVNAFATAAYTAGRQPQIQLKATLDLGAGKAWVAMKSQPFKGTAPAADFTMKGVEIGGSYAVGGLSLLGNFQSGNGLGVLADGDNGDQKQTAYLLQATYAVAPKLKMGLSYGSTRLKDSVGSALKSNTNTTAGAYYALTKSVTLVAEISRTDSKSAAGAKADMNGVALGGILFF
ncbi:Porin_4 domain-containing protein [Rubrivivax sp. A210]|uniref:porin n=1 Tax=Rubrivivax sp. A210 TaxID=2772301 RepID=UPI0019195760|nr:porin [Rubrivivax sp. A210]CAD5373819.1 Porin_4 domain-containing protein [Rubrivivax sp. A210]